MTMLCGSPRGQFQTGASGSGKTRTVKVLESHMLETKVGVFVEGKFDLNTVDEPYSGIGKAIAAICQIISCGDKWHADNLRETVSNVLHDDEAQLLVHLVPRLEDIILVDVKEATINSAVDVDELENGIERLI